MAATVITPHCAAALRAAIALGTAAWSAVPARTQELPPPAYQIAAAQSSVPSSVLYAVALQESGNPAARPAGSLAVDAQHRRHAAAARHAR